MEVHYIERRELPVPETVIEMVQYEVFRNNSDRELLVHIPGISYGKTESDLSKNKEGLLDFTGNEMLVVNFTPKTKQKSKHRRDAE